MKNGLSEILVFSLISIIGIFSQFQLAFLILIFYLLGWLFSKYLLKTESAVVVRLYALFFFIYGSLCCLTQVFLIHNPTTDYYISFDAANSFYYPFSYTAKTTNWGDLIESTLFDYQYSDRPLTSLVGSAIIKIGYFFDVEDTRLLGRFWIVMMASLIPAIIASALKIYKIEDKKILKYIIPFGLFTYLYLSSTVYIRDLQICFYFTLASYLSLLPKCRFRLLLFLIVFALTFGHRMESGVLLTIYILGYYFTKFNNKIGMIAYFLMAIVILAALYYAQEILYDVEDTLGRYDEYAKENTGGLFEKLYSLPFPVNTIFMVGYMILMPLPATKYILEPGGSWLSLPYVLSPFVFSLVLLVSIWFLFNKFNLKDKHIILIIITLLAFIATTFGSPDIRRSFASIPGLFMVYCVVRPEVPRRIISGIKIFIWPIILFIQIFFLVYTLK